MNIPDKVEILLVEDNADDAELTLRTLKKHNLGNHVEWVRDGAEALAFIFGDDAHPTADIRKPRLIMLDLRLPKVDGLEVLQRLKSDARARVLPVVVLTSSTQQEDLERCYALGANSFVSKPVQFERFADQVAQLGLYWLLVNKPPL